MGPSVGSFMHSLARLISFKRFWDAVSIYEATHRRAVDLFFNPAIQVSWNYSMMVSHKTFHLKSRKPCLSGFQKNETPVVGSSLKLVIQWKARISDLTLQINRGLNARRRDGESQALEVGRWFASNDLMSSLKRLICRAALCRAQFSVCLCGDVNWATYFAALSSTRLCIVML